MFAEASEISCFLSSHPSQQNSLAASSGRTSNSSLLVSWDCSDLLYLYCIYILVHLKSSHDPNIVPLTLLFIFVASKCGR